MELILRQTLNRYYPVGLFYFLGALLACLGMASVSVKWSILLAVFLWFTFLFAVKIEWGMYALAFFLPVIHWDFYIMDFIIPFIDILGILMISAFLLRYIFLLVFAPVAVPRLKWPFFLPYFLFVSSVTVSSLLAPDILDSLWYSTRWILFFYTAYVFVPINVIQDKQILKKVLIAFVLSGLVTALMGLISFADQDWRHAYVRVLPISIFGVWPLGENQNLIVEVLLPATFYILLFRNIVEDRVLRRGLNIILVFMVTMLVLTFSRGAWLSLLVCGLLFLIYHYRQRLRHIMIPVYVIATVMTPVFVYMYFMQTDYSIGVGSTRSRIQSTEIAIEGWRDNPWFGIGPGEYIHLVENNVRFTATFGDPLESHGFLQKVLAETGGIGLTFFIIMLSAIAGQIIYYIRKYPEHRAWLVPIALAALAIFMLELTNTSYYKGKLWLPIALALLSGPVLVRSTMNKELRIKNKTINNIQ